MSARIPKSLEQVIFIPTARDGRTLGIGNGGVVTADDVKHAVRSQRDAVRTMFANLGHGAKALPLVVLVVTGGVAQLIEAGSLSSILSDHHVQIIINTEQTLRGSDG